MGDWQGPLLVGPVPTVFKTAVVTSTGAGNTLGVNLSFALTAGELRVNVYGTEE